MRTFERTFIINSLCFAAIAAGTIMACSTANPSDTPTDDAGGVTGDEGGTTDEGGALPDGALPDTSAPPQKCLKSADCPSGVCNQATGVCAVANCKDGVKNAAETDIDCGGTDCAKCDMLKGCAAAKDCVTGVCTDPDGKGKKCQPPSSTDGVKNGNETGIDCGGTGNPLCTDGKGCKTLADCSSGYCKALVCAPVLPDDGVKNGTETDVDCGGPGGAKRCADNLMCLIDSDCTGTVCKDLADGNGLRCQPPSYTDGKMNGAETDVDCGGDPAYPCATGKSCKVGGDCTSTGCDYNFKCAAGRSCTAHYGGDTCGTGGAGGYPGEAASWESCCTTIPVTTSVGGVPQTVYMDKYPTTSGRMRVFLESIGYDVRTAVQTIRAAGQMPVIPLTASNAVDGVKPVLDASWDPFLPTSFAGNGGAGEIADCNQGGTCTLANGECPSTTTCVAGQQQAGIYTAVRNHLGGTIFKNNSQTSTGCYVGSPGTHSFRFPDAMKDSAVVPEQPFEVYDTKTQNCVDYLMAQSFCVWDGGRLETFQEWQTAYGGSATPWAPGDTRLPQMPGTGTYFGCRFPWATDADQSQCSIKWNTGTNTVELADYKYSYEYPKLGSTDYIVFLTAPGRTKGRGPLGHSDLLGAGFEITSNVTSSTWDPAVPNSGPFAGRHRWTGNGSWEVHNYSRTYTGQSELLNKYGKLGMRCVKFAPN